MGILSGNPTDEPMHYGEVFGTWSYVSTSKGLVSGYQTFLNYVGDKDLHKLVQETIEQCQQEIKSIETLLKENGVGLPPTPPERPEACLDDIPVGARVQDPEVAAAISMNIAAGLVTCSQLIGQSIREDIAAMFAQIHMQKVALGGKFLRLNKEKGWLIPPPLHKSKKTDC
ncbi:DUF3231 family protein [Priestia megaterium]|jgi:hypothetical protein|uniref:DUF3231 family protein n=1 Tax=Priestia megaterium TaxID=1404 RepID=UPI0039A1E8CF